MTADGGLMPPDLVGVLRDPTITIQRDHEIRLDDGRTLSEHLQEWRNAPSNTASADLPVTADGGLTPEREQEIREWLDDFEAGQFHIHCHKCGAGEPYLPPEFFGGIKAERFLLAALDAERARNTALSADLAAVTQERDEWESTARIESDGLMEWYNEAQRVIARVETLENALRRIANTATPWIDAQRIARAALAEPSGPGGNPHGQEAE